MIICSIVRWFIFPLDIDLSSSIVSFGVVVWKSRISGIPTGGIFWLFSSTCLKSLLGQSTSKSYSSVCKEPNVSIYPKIYSHIFSFD